MEWLTTAAIKAFVSAILSHIFNFFREVHHEEMVEAKAKAEMERDQAREGERVNSALAEEAAKRVDENEVIDKLEKGEA